MGGRQEEDEREGEAERFAERDTAMLINSLLCAVFPCMGMYCRKQIRDAFSIQGSMSGDCFACACCFPCAVSWLDIVFRTEEPKGHAGGEGDQEARRKRQCPRADSDQLEITRSTRPAPRPCSSSKSGRPRQVSSCSQSMEVTV